jgi:hypothetical protein
VQTSPGAGSPPTPDTNRYWSIVRGATGGFPAGAWATLEVITLTNIPAGAVMLVNSSYGISSTALGVGLYTRILATNGTIQAGGMAQCNAPVASSYVNIAATAIVTATAVSPVIYMQTYVDGGTGSAQAGSHFTVARIV